MDVFISWTTPDREVKSLLAEKLDQAGIKCWVSDELCVSNFAEELSFDEISSELMSRVYLPRTPLGAARTLGLVGRLASDMRHIRLGCNMETEAAEVAARAFGAAVV